MTEFARGSSWASHTTGRLIGCKSLNSISNEVPLARLFAISLSGVPATGVKIRVAFSTVVNIRGDRLYHEHILWDQASVLRQLDLLPDYLPFPYALADGSLPAPGNRFEYRVPATGIDTVLKTLNKNIVESNEDAGVQSSRGPNHRC